MSYSTNIYMFQKLWEGDSLIAMVEFDRALRTEKDEEIRNQMSAIVADQLRFASSFKRQYLIYLVTNRFSLFTKLHLSMQFRSKNEIAFPRLSIFYNEGRKKPPPLHVYDQCIRVQGTNEEAQLGFKHGTSFYEPARLNFPQCRKIEMGTNFTLFLKMNGELYVSGLVSTFFGQSRSGHIYGFDEPSPFPYCQDEEVMDIAVSEAYSAVLTEKYIYIFGECLKFHNLEAQTTWESDTSWESKAGKRFEIEGYEEGCKYILTVREDVVKVIYMYGDKRENKCVSFNNDKPPPAFFQYEKVALKVTEVNMSHRNGTNIKMLFSQFEDSIKTSSEGKPYECITYLDGRVIHNKNIVKFVVSEDGRILVHFKIGLMARGKVELLMRRKNPRMPANERGVGDEIVAVILFEMPETYGVTSFSASPDCENIIMQIGTVPSYWGREFLNNEFLLFYWNILNDDFEKEFVKERTINIDNSTMKFALKNLISCHKKWQKKYPTSEPQSLFVAIQACSSTMLCVTKLSKEGSDSYKSLDMTGKIQFVERAFRLRNHSHTFNSFTNCFVDCMKSRSFPEDKATIRMWIFICITIRMMTNALMENGEYIEKKYLNGEQIKKQDSTLKLDDIVEIKKNNQNTLWPLPDEEIPLDLDVILLSNGVLKSKIKVRRNETLFRIMYPQLSMKIVEKTLFVNPVEFGHIYYRGGFVQRIKQTETYSAPDGMELLRHRDEQNRVFYKLKSDETITDLFPHDADPADLWTLNTIDGKSVKVHKNLLLLHSLLIRAQTKPSKSQEDDESCLLQKPTRSFDVPATEQDVIEAFIAVLDPLALFKKSIFEVMDIVMFYDYMFMFAARDNAIDVVFQKATPNTFSCLYEIYDKFGDQVMDKFVQNEHLFFLMCIESMPPMGLIKALEEIKSKEEPVNKLWFEQGEGQNAIDWNDISFHFFNIENAKERALREIAAKEFDIVFVGSESREPPTKQAKLMSSSESSSNADNN